MDEIIGRRVRVVKGKFNVGAEGIVVYRGMNKFKPSKLTTDGRYVRDHSTDTLRVRLKNGSEIWTNVYNVEELDIEKMVVV